MQRKADSFPRKVDCIGGIRARRICDFLVKNLPSHGLRSVFFRESLLKKLDAETGRKKESDFPAIDWTGGKERNFKTIEYMKRDSLFDKWFAFNYERLRAVFGRYLNEDAFHDAYLAMKKTCAFSDVAVERFEPYFFGVYKKCKSMCLRGESRYCHPDKEHFFLLRPEEETPSAEALAASDRLAYDILLFVRNKYPKRDYELFRLKEYEAQCSFRSLSAYAGISASAVRQRIGGIADALRSHPGFSRRYACVNM